MTNVVLIEKAIALAKTYYKNNNISFSEKIIRDRVEYWYNNSDIADEEILAAMAINGEYHFYNYDEILAIKEYYFPSFELDCFSAGEYEEAMRDLLWMGENLCLEG